MLVVMAACITFFAPFCAPLFAVTAGPCFGHVHGPVARSREELSILRLSLQVLQCESDKGFHFCISQTSVAKGSSNIRAVENPILSPTLFTEADKTN